MDQIYPETGFSTVKILEKLGIKVHYNPEQTCCGQPAYNGGHWDAARDVAEKFLGDFNTGRTVVSPSASCTGMIRSGFNHLFENTSLHNACRQLQRQSYELTEFLVDVLGVTDLGARFPHKVTFHDSCSGLRECFISQQPRKLLEKVADLELVELPDNTTCCGFGGTFSVKFEPIAVAMGEQKLHHALSTGAEYLVSTDVSCLLHLDGYVKKHNLPIQTIHIADLLAKALD